MTGIHTPRRLQRDWVHRQLHRLGRRVTQTWGAGRKKLQGLSTDFADRVGEWPRTSVLLACGLGFGFGVLWRSS